MAEFIDTESLESRPLRPELAAGVTGRSLLSSPFLVMTLTRVEPGGSFQAHRDAYGHLFLVLSGRGEVQAGNQRRLVGPGQIVRIAPGEEHGYSNPGPADWLLISCNLPGEG